MSSIPLPGFFQESGKIAFNTDTKKEAICEPRGCCESIPDLFEGLIWLVEGQSGGDVLLECELVTFTRDRNQSEPTWYAELSNAIWNNCMGPHPFWLRFRCLLVSQNCRGDQIISGFILEGFDDDPRTGGNSLTQFNIDECCCLGNDPGMVIDGVADGEFCYLGAIGTSWSGAKDTTQGGCAGGTFQDANDGVLNAWLTVTTDQYALEPCCMPVECPLTPCPPTNCVEPMAMGFPPPPEEFQKWF